MKWLIVTPAPRRSTKGNRVTAERWAKILRSLGHQATVLESRSVARADLVGREYDAMIALHAHRSATAVRCFRSALPGALVIVALTGTDLHRDLARSSTAMATVEMADQLILLEPEGLNSLSREAQGKARVIYQSASAVKKPPPPLQRFFEITVVGHLRSVKDPFRAAMAARDLPTHSRIRIVHIGAALSSAMQLRADKEMKRNPRYRWIGGLSHHQAKRRLSRSRLTVLTSKIEGAPSVLSEAVVAGVPVLATRIPASFGLLGHDYPGLFPVGATIQLRQLMLRAEQDPSFYQQLGEACHRVQARFAPDEEAKAWARLVEELLSKQC